MFLSYSSKAKLSQLFQKYRLGNQNMRETNYGKSSWRNQKIICTCEASANTLISINSHIIKKQWRNKDEKPQKSFTEVQDKGVEHVEASKNEMSQKTHGKANSHFKRCSLHLRREGKGPETDMSMWARPQGRSEGKERNHPIQQGCWSVGISATR